MSPIKCAVYARYSSRNQRVASIDDQIRICREFAKTKNWEILEDHIYIDKAKSGQSIASRNGFKALQEIALGTNPPFQYILVDDTSRVARNLIEALQIFESLTAKDVYIYCISQGIDTKEETASELITIYGMVDSIYLRTLSHKTYEGIKGRLEAGFSAGGRHYGYKSRPEYSGKTDRYGEKEIIGYHREIDPQEAETVKRIFTLYGEEKWSAKRIAVQFNKEIKETGHPKPPVGEYWSETTISGSPKAFRGILYNELYIGKYIWNRTKGKFRSKPNGKKLTINPPESWLEMDRPHLRIISDDLWALVKVRQREVRDRCQGRMANAKHLYSEHLLTRVAKCGTCSGTIGIVTGGKYKKYGCTTNWNKGIHVCTNTMKLKMEILEDGIISTLCKEFLEKEAIAAITSEIHCSLKEFIQNSKKDRGLAVIEQDIQVAQEELANIANAIKKGIIGETTAALLMDTENRIRNLKNEFSLFEVDNIDDINFNAIISQKDLEEFFAKVVAKLRDPETRRDTLYSIVDKIVIHYADENKICADVKIHESLSKTVSYIMDLVGRRETRIKMQTGAGLHLYTSRIFNYKMALDNRII
ncbi:MAG: recombinase family protein [Nitrospirae bacterium]|nr:recombinase family protein [Nitrospirota bacterium]